MSEDIYAAVATVYSVSVTQIKGFKRTPPLPEARRMVKYIMRDHGYNRETIKASTACTLSWTTRSIIKFNVELRVYQDVKTKYLKALDILNNNLKTRTNEKQRKN